eukprot:3397810-Pleurochrysis_carterae.AAC.2
MGTRQQRAYATSGGLWHEAIKGGESATTLHGRANTKAHLWPTSRQAREKDWDRSALEARQLHAEAA